MHQRIIKTNVYGGETNAGNVFPLRVEETLMSIKKMNLYGKHVQAEGERTGAGSRFQFEVTVVTDRGYTPRYNIALGQLA